MSNKIRHQCHEPIILLLTALLLHGCVGNGLVRGPIEEIDVGADSWDRKELVTVVQDSLHELGYEPGNVNGIESEQTLSSVKQYRIDQGLPISTQIDGKLEKHINDFIWETRFSNSVDPNDLARKIVRNRHHEECVELFGENYENEVFPENSSAQSHIYLYRINNAYGEKPDYPISKIFLDKREVGELGHNEFIKIETTPGIHEFSEQDTTQLKNKTSKNFTFSSNAGEVYFIQISVGKTNTPNLVQTDAPFYVGFGVLDVLIGEVMWDLMNQDKYSKTYYFSNFIKSDSSIGKCHIRLLTDR